MNNQIISINDFLKLTGLKSRTSYYNLIKNDPTAPRQVRVGIRKVGLPLNEVHEWLELRRAERKHQS